MGWGGGRVTVSVLTFALPWSLPQASWCRGSTLLPLMSPACRSSSAVTAYSGMTISAPCLIPCLHPRY